MTAYYNENDQRAAAWLRALISEGHIADGVVDTRSIVDVVSTDLDGFTQCHFFAGIGGWSYALRLVGWPDDRHVWTGSCPCQPFSDAGKKRGFDDERHLWPEFYRLIRESRPQVVFGEQVASPDGLAWVDVVQTDMEDAGYAFAAFDLCAAGVGAFHGRQRLYFVADGISYRRGEGRDRNNRRYDRNESDAGCPDVGVGVADTENIGRQRAGSARRRRIGSEDDGSVGVALGDTDGTRSQGQPERGATGGDQCAIGPASAFGVWIDPEWIYCTDGKYRPTQPGLFPLAHGIPARVGRLRGYGNAIVPQLASTFIKAYTEVRDTE